MKEMEATDVLGGGRQMVVETVEVGTSEEDRRRNDQAKEPVMMTRSDEMRCARWCRE